MAKAQPVKGLDPCAPAAHNARLIALQRLEELYGWSQAADDPHDTRRQHHLRIAVKRLRYTLELFQEVLPEECQAVLAELEQLQEELGRLHDHDVLIALLKGVLTRAEGDAIDETAQLISLPPALGEPPLAIQGSLCHLLPRLLEERERHFLAFRQHWQELEARHFRQELQVLLRS
ncbi:CHAD domain-containing protein [Thermogemmatispora onikobensis]|uniref:CHAD domain-containing protein n=1 Tax=Thermogemmatispora onikobensis TaxID=732234 RepID=UPI000852D990|nr:CHAD domain-containing protein [Thermogemmatispora onikobensis]